MKRVIRRGVFETNSSSTHSITMVSSEDYNKWQNGELFYCDGEFITKENAIKELKDDNYFIKSHPDFDFEDEEALEDVLYDWEYYTYNKYWNKYENYYETYANTYTTKNGEEIIAFGYYGMDN